MFVKKGVEEIKSSDIDRLQEIVEYYVKAGIGELNFG